MSLPPLDSPSYKWIFVGGKGGVGKTTTACAIAVNLTRTRSRVLLVSTDPASNIGDTFQQHFSSEPLPVNGVDRLWAMEFANVAAFPHSDSLELQQISGLPGIDEMQVLSSFFDSLDRNEYDVVVFDTAPTGHTMRLLEFPTTFQSVFGMFRLFGDSAIAAITQTLGGSPGLDVSAKFARTQRLIRNADQRLKNPTECTFVCVLLPEFLPLFETERLIQFLRDHGFESHVLVVNGIVAEQAEEICADCFRRFQMQQKYIRDIEDLYGEFQIHRVPMLDEEVKGVEKVMGFAELLSPLFVQ
jgi:arsenite-transporting ATPase